MKKVKKRNLEGNYINELHTKYDLRYGYTINGKKEMFIAYLQFFDDDFNSETTYEQLVTNRLKLIYPRINFKIICIQSKIKKGNNMGYPKIQLEKPKRIQKRKTKKSIYNLQLETI